MLNIPQQQSQHRMIRLDVATVCQLKCPSCPTASGATGKRLGSGFLKAADFRKFIDDNPQVSHIELSNWGEVFLNKDLVSIFRYAYQRNVALSITNGANLNTIRPEALEALVKYKVRKITCSIDGATQETYEKYRVKGDLRQVLDNIKTINQWKKRCRSPYPELRWQFIAFGHNEHEISQARKLAEELDMEFFLKLNWGDLYVKEVSPVKDADLIRRESSLGVKDRDEYREKYGEDYFERFCCRDMWVSPQINYDGKVLGCPVNYWGDYGNAFQDGLSECLDGEKINYARGMLMGKKEARKDIPCTTCKIYARMKKDKAWIPQDFQSPHIPARSYVLMENKILGRQRTAELSEFIYNARDRSRKYVNAAREGRIKDLIRMSSDALRHRLSSTLPPAVHPLVTPLDIDAGLKWKPYPFFRGASRSFSDMSCHASVLTQGHIPHPPHIHKEEEILMMLAGEADLILPGLAAGGGSDRVRLTPGQFVYYPAGFYHTLQQTGPVPANYLMFKWYKDRPPHEPKQLSYVLYDTKPLTDLRADGFKADILFEGATQCLGKLHAHTSSLKPGAGYKPHADPYDVAMIVLEGEVETLGRRAHPHNVIFYPAGRPHGIFNPGHQTARYAVFEFHP